MIWVFDGNLLTAVNLDKGSIIANGGRFLYLNSNGSLEIALPIPQLLNTKDKEMLAMMNFTNRF